MTSRHDATASPSDSGDIHALVGLLSASTRVVFFGGAGVSTESGIPDFRSAAGLYTTHAGDQYPPEYLLSATCLRDDPQAFFDFHRKYLMHPEARPNAAHQALARLEDAGRLLAVVTQNIDGLHQMAGSRVVHELHGSVHRNHCVQCRRRYGWDVVLGSTGVPRCPACGGMVRPGVVLYEEALDPQVVDASVEAILAADLLIVGGTSLAVYPAAGLVEYSRAPLVLMNLSITPQDQRAALVVRRPIGAALARAAGVVLDEEH